MTVNEVSKLSGVSIRCLQYYDKIGLLIPEKYSEAGYRLYGYSSLERLQQILLFRELEFPLKEIKQIIDSPGYNKTDVILQQIDLLTLKKQRIDSLIEFAERLKMKEGNIMDFDVFNKKKEEEYTSLAKEKWGNTKQFKEFEENTKNKSEKDKQDENNEFMRIFERIGEVKTLDISDNKVQILIKALQEYISSHYYNCSNEILYSLGEMYVADPEFKTNIDNAGGEGTADFTNKAIKFYCR